ncbi:hypothetical protein CSB08_01295 [Candidatus Gracilibacteria bacterium]|nr:MAG: hypothetical protein CSB08_01295 [Candidatus Gracilibacteria bacterium]PIE85394.1 MAG: hypothetical protein CSA08_02350 [Candidatus Gracilibacteria bacterium]
MDGSVIITRYKEPDDIFHEALLSLSKQINIKLEILVLDQFMNSDTELLCKKYNEISDHDFKYILIKPISLSYARNFGVKKSSTDYCLFLDADAIADNNWAKEVVSGFIDNEKVGVIGTKILPKWNGNRNIFTFSNFFLSEYSLLNLGDDNLIVNKVIGASFAINKKLLSKDSYFDENLGRKDGVLLGGEETELCERAINKGFNVMYVGKSFVYHQISSERLSYSWIIKRVFWGGVSRGMKGGKPVPVKMNRKFLDYLLLPFYLLFYVPGLIYSRLLSKFNKKG